MKRTLAVIAWMLAATVSHAQAWSGVVDPARAVDWSTAGAGAIPARATTCASLTTAANAATINAAIASCTSGQTVFLAAGTYNLVNGLVFNNKSNVTLRGAGADQTLLVFTGSQNVKGVTTSIGANSNDTNYAGGPSNTANWTFGYSPGTTVITLSNVTNLAIGSPLILDQINDTTGTPAATGISICDTQSTCAIDTPSGGARSGRAQQQIVTVTGISGFNVTISPGLYMPNWRTGQTPQAWWATSPVKADGVEDLSIDNTSSSNDVGVFFFNCGGCWVKGIRSSTPGRSHVQGLASPRMTVRDSYFYANQSSGSVSYGLETFATSDSLFENNILQFVPAPLMMNSSCSGCVFSFNFSVNQYYSGSSTWQQQGLFAHSVVDFVLMEGNIGPGLYADSFHGTHHFLTMFRNRFSGREPNNGTTTTDQTIPAILYPWSRYFNIIGNVLGTSGYHTIYQETSSDASHNVTIYTLGTVTAGNPYSFADDAFTPTSLMRWGNYDTVSAANRFVSGEVPSGLSPYGNAVPGSTTLPASFYLAAQPSFWPGTIPWPAIGPDVTGGNIPNVGGHANKTPAETCYLTTMSGPTNGTGSILTFNAGTCYTVSSTPAATQPTVIMLAQKK